MSSNNLLLSLLANSSSSSRSSSLMFKNTSSNPYCNLRSNSISHAETKKQKEGKDHRDERLIKFGHFLNVKVKNIYFFVFCKLQQQNKLHKMHNKKIQQQALRNAKQQQAPMKAIPQPSQQRIKSKGSITGLIDTISTIISKRQLLQKDQISKAFSLLYKASQRRKALEKVPKILYNQLLNRKRQIFRLFCKIQKDKMRAQIFTHSLGTICENYIKKSFQLIKICERYHQRSHVYSQTSAQIQKTQDTSRCLLTDRTEDDYPLSSQKIIRSKRIILRQRKPNINQPLTLNIKDRLKPIPMNFDTPISTNRIQNDGKMSLNLNIKSDNLLKCIPDLSDNCNLFGQIQPPCFTINSISSQENIITQSKEYSDMEQMSSCLSDRSNHLARGRSNSIKNTPKYVKDSSQTSLMAVNKKEVTLEDSSQSSLTKIEEIIQKMEEMKEYKTKQKSAQKRMLNINISKDIHQYSSNSSAIKYRKKTPTYRYQQTQKQNIRQRLVTQREKPRKAKPNGLDSIPKTKSTMLAKPKQSQLSTAKKMKMEIQNIINRRNKQLFYRAQSVQLN